MAGWLAHKLQDFLLSPVPSFHSSTGTTSRNYLVLLHMGSGAPVWLSPLSREVLYSLSHVPIPKGWKLVERKTEELVSEI